ncbi:cobaltochelatase subunit CobN [Prevotella sp. E15-22]|uniref:cobaltochelatase subunit CobN n=1 Tax=Prevotella sp. E15-22 TaxID=2937774 RepID=UPI003530BD70
MKKKYIFLSLLSALLVFILTACWRTMCSRTDVAFVNYQVITLGEISKANDNSFIRLHVAPLDDIDSWSDYDAVVINGMGLRITEEQRQQIQTLADKGLPILTTAVTNPANNIVSMDEWDADSLKQYLAEGGTKNYRSFLNYLRNEVDGKLFFLDEVEPVEEQEAELFYHLGAPHQGNAPRILISGMMGDATDLIAALEASGDVVYATRDLNTLIKTHAIDSIQPSAIINMAHGRLGDAVVDYLKTQNIPLFSTVNVNRMTEEWEADKQGMQGGFLSQSIITPEIDGMIRPFVLFAIREGKDGLPEAYTIPERLATFVKAVNKHLALKTISNKDKKVAIVYFKGPGSNALTASGLEVVPSLYNLLVKMREEGYTVKDLPASAEGLDALIQHSGSVFGTYAEGAQAKFLNEGQPQLITKRDFNTWTKALFTKEMHDEMLRVNGQYPGHYLAKDAETLGLPVIHLGNIVLMPQMPAGTGSDSFKMVHGTETAPPYPYIAQYLWLQEGFKADALIHFGTHGSLEYTPGKQVALSQNCWNDRLVGTLPHFYLYTISNVGEAMIAKRRTYASLVSYLTPPFMESNLRGLYGQLSVALETYDKTPSEKASLAVKALTIQMGIHRELHLDSVKTKPYTEAEVARIEAFAEELMNEKITSKFYTLGVPYEQDRIQSSVFAMATEPIAYSLLALDKMQHRAAADTEKHPSLFTARYLNPAKALVAKLLSRQGEVTESEVCQIAHITTADLHRAHHIDSILAAPQQMMSMMMSNGMTHPSPSLKGGKNSPAMKKNKMPGNHSLPAGRAEGGSSMSPKKALAMAKMMGATPEQLKKMKEAMMGKKGTTDKHTDSKMQNMSPAMQAIVDKVAEAGMLSKQDKDFSRVVLEVERTIRNVGNYRTALLTSPTIEMTSLLNALCGGYTAPSPGGDVISNPNAVPTGRNLYGINAETCPTEQAWEKGKELAENTIRLYRERHHDSIPRKVSYTLWSSEFIETGGATIAQCLYLLGVEPIRDAFGRVTDIRLIPSKELGRPRIDVVVQTSGQLRDLAASRLFLITRAVEMAAQAEDKEHPNMVAQGVKEAERVLVEKGLSPKEAREVSTHRVFGGVNGNYGTGIQGMTMASDRWENESELAEVYLNNMGAYYGKEDQWEDMRQYAFEAALANTDAVIQPRQSNTWGALSLDHVYEFMGGMNMAVRHVTGKEPDAYLSDYRNRNHAKMQEVKEAIGVESRTTLFNPTYIKEKMQGGASDANTFAELVQNTYGWNVMKPEAIDNEMWDGIYDTYVKDQFNLGTRTFFEQKNPAALQEMTAVMMESARKGYWKASDAQLKDIAQLHTELVKKYGASGSQMVSDNQKLQDFIAKKVDAASAKAYQQQINEVRHEQVSDQNSQVLKKEEMSSTNTTTTIVNSVAVVVIAIVFIILIALLVRRRRQNMSE